MNARQIKLGNVNANQLYTKSEYAKKIGKSNGRITQMVAEGKLTILLINGGYVIFDDK